MDDFIRKNLKKLLADRPDLTIQHLSTEVAKRNKSYLWQFLDKNKPLTLNDDVRWRLVEFFSVSPDQFFTKEELARRGLQPGAAGLQETSREYKAAPDVGNVSAGNGPPMTPQEEQLHAQIQITRIIASLSRDAKRTFDISAITKLMRDICEGADPAVTDPVKKRNA